jgi:hypothetical protein
LKQHHGDIGHRLGLSSHSQHIFNCANGGKHTLETLSASSRIALSQLAQVILDVMRQLRCLFNTHHCRQAFEGMKISQQIVKHALVRPARSVRWVEGNEVRACGTQVFLALSEVVIQKLVKERLPRIATHCEFTHWETRSKSARGSNGFVR